MFNDTHFKVTDTKPLIYRFGFLIFTQMWSEYLDMLNMGIHYLSSVIVVNHIAVKLKREADSLEVDLQRFIIIPITVSKNVFTGSVVNNT